MVLRVGTTTHHFDKGDNGMGFVRFVTIIIWGAALLLIYAGFSSGEVGFALLVIVLAFWLSVKLYENEITYQPQKFTNEDMLSAMSGEQIAKEVTRGIQR